SDEVRGQKRFRRHEGNVRLRRTLRRTQPLRPLEVGGWKYHSSLRQRNHLETLSTADRGYSVTALASERRPIATRGHQRSLRRSAAASEALSGLWRLSAARGITGVAAPPTTATALGRLPVGPAGPRRTAPAQALSRL